MVSMYTYSQALRMYRAHGVRVPVQLSASALALHRKRTRGATTGLRELAAAQLPTVHRSTYQSDADFAAELLAMRCDVADGMPVAVALPLHNFATRAFA